MKMWKEPKETADAALRALHTPVREAHTCKKLCNARSGRGLWSHDRESWLSSLEEGPWKDQLESARWGEEASGKEDVHVLQASRGENTLEPLENSATGELRGSRWPKELAQEK